MVDVGCSMTLLVLPECNKKKSYHESGGGNILNGYMDTFLIRIASRSHHTSFERYGTCRIALQNAKVLLMEEIQHQSRKSEYPMKNCISMCFTIPMFSSIAQRLLHLVYLHSPRITQLGLGLVYLSF